MIYLGVKQGVNYPLFVYRGLLSFIYRIIMNMPFRKFYAPPSIDTQDTVMVSFSCQIHDLGSAKDGKIDI